MIKPGIEEVKSYAGYYDMVPVQEEIYADVVTPILLLRKMAVCQ